jgi:hypothetical protein
MSFERATSGAKLALLSVALLLLVAACGKESNEPASQGTTPSTEQPAAPGTGQPAQKQ